MIEKIILKNNKMQLSGCGTKIVVMKFLICIICAMTMTYTLKAQDNIQYINRELRILDNKLTKKGENYKLTNVQISEFTNVLTEKYQRIESLKSRKMIKDEISKELIKIEKEFQPRILGILSLEQRSAIASVNSPVSSH